MSNAKQQATRLLEHYIRVPWDAAGIKWDNDNSTEVAELVGYIIEAVGQEREHKLCDELREWCANNEIPYESADDIMFKYRRAPAPTLTVSQYRWLDDYIRRWDAMQEAQR